MRYILSCIDLILTYYSPLLRFMRPGTPHFVVTTEDCLAVGGHFYCRSTYSATLDALACIHFLGNVLTNTSHDTAPVILFKSMEYWHSYVQSGEQSEGCFLYLHKCRI